MDGMWNNWAKEIETLKIMNIFSLIAVLRIFLSMTDGNLYRCPFSANVVRLNGMPDELSQSDGYNFRGLNNSSNKEKIDARIRD